MRPNRHTRPLSFSLEPRTAAFIADYAAKHGTSRSAVVEQALRLMRQREETRSGGRRE